MIAQAVFDSLLQVRDQETGTPDTKEPWNRAPQRHSHAGRIQIASFDSQTALIDSECHLVTTDRGPTELPDSISNSRHLMVFQVGVWLLKQVMLARCRTRLSRKKRCLWNGSASIFCRRHFWHGACVMEGNLEVRLPELAVAADNNDNEASKTLR